tara:strand:+ start:2319 stop:3086 length:768 start_codon:yes stop_codon:yes gene_type:complete
MGQYFSYFIEDEIELNKYGWKRDSPDYRDKYIHYSSPLEVDDIDLRHKMPGIYDQLNIGSSVANSAAAAYEYNQIEIDDEHIFIPSRLFIYYNTRKIENTILYDAGSQIRNTIKSLNKYGICSETKWCYDPTILNIKPDDSCYIQIPSIKYFRLNQNIITLKACLTNSVPFIFGFSVYSNFEKIDKNNNTLSIPTKDDKYLGGHSCLCVGYDNSKKHFIVRNSFGVEWGDKGHFKLSYDYMINKNLCSDFWIIKC